MRFKIIPEVHLILKRDNQLLLLRRANTGYMDGYYSLVAGHVDGNETFMAAMIREAQEEAGIAIDQDDLALSHVMHRRTTEERLSLFFTASKWGGDVVNMEPDKCDDLSWFDMGNIPQNTIPYISTAITHAGNGVGYSEFGWG